MDNEDLVDEKLAYFLPVVFAELTQVAHLQLYTEKGTNLFIARRVKVRGFNPKEGASDVVWEIVSVVLCILLILVGHTAIFKTVARLYSEVVPS